MLRLSLLFLLAAAALAQPLQEQEEDGEAASRSSRRRGQLTSLVRGSRGGSAPLRRAVISVDAAEAMSLPMEFNAKEKKRPKGKHLRTSRLLRKMGPDFDPSWMSARRPSEALLSGKTVELGENQLAELVAQVAALDLDRELKELDGEAPDEDNFIDQDFEEESVRTRMIGVFQEWLIQKSSCPVSYKWKDLGDYFWPRWIKQGRCGGIATDPAIEEEDAEGDYDDEDAEEESAGEMSSSPGQNFGCSWPPGMRCGKGKTKVLHILRWHCKRRSLHHHGTSPGSKKYKCRWYKVPFPVTESCRCT